MFPEYRQSHPDPFFKTPDALPTLFVHISECSTPSFIKFFIAFLNFIVWFLWLLGVCIINRNREQVCVRMHLKRGIHWYEDMRRHGQLEIRHHMVVRSYLESEIRYYIGVRSHLGSKNLWYLSVKPVNYCKNRRYGSDHLLEL